MSDGKVFVRECPACGKLHQTADQTGKSKCDTCCIPVVLRSTPPAPVTPPVVEKPKAKRDVAVVSTFNGPVGSVQTGDDNNATVKQEE